MAIIGAAVLPHPPLAAGKVALEQKKLIQSTVDSFLRIAKKIQTLSPETIVLISPHAPLYADYFHLSSSQENEKILGDFSRFGDSKTKVEAVYDKIFVDALSTLCKKDDFPCGTLGKKEAFLDHGVTVPLYFVQKEYTDFALVRLGLSGLSLAEHYELGIKIAETAEKLNKKTFILASGDLSHKLLYDGPYGWAAEGAEYDKKVMEVLEKALFGELLSFDEAFLEKAAECGHRSFCVMAGCFDGLAVEAKKLSYEGPFGVGYGAAFFKPQKKDKSRHFLEAYKQRETKRLKEKQIQESPYVQLARESIERFVKNGEVLNLGTIEKAWLKNLNLPKEAFREKAGCFVSLKKNGKLRGCIGTLGPTQKFIAEDIVINAISAATRDRRFEPIRVDELASIEYSVDILSAAEPIASEKELDVIRYGVIVSSGYKKGLLLPNLEGVDSVEMQVSIAMQKAGIMSHEDYSLERFEVIRYD